MPLDVFGLVRAGRETRAGQTHAQRADELQALGDAQLIIEAAFAAGQAAALDLLADGGLADERCAIVAGHVSRMAELIGIEADRRGLHLTGPPPAGH